MSYIPLATVTLGGSDADIVFTNIPALFKDLVVIFNGSISTSNNSPFYMNGDTTSGNYGRVSAWGTGSATGSGAFYGAIWSGSQNTVIYNFMDYCSTDKHKVALVRCNNAANEVSMQAIRWANTAAITSLTFLAGSGPTYTTGSTFSLYGVV
jgi:hypothetical protein